MLRAIQFESSEISKKNRIAFINHEIMKLLIHCKFIE